MYLGSRNRPPHASLLSVMLLTVVAGCSEKKAEDLGFDVRFACADDREAADELTVRVLRGGCAGEEAVYEATLAKGDSAPPANGVGPGAYGLEARASRAGELLARVCVEITLPRAGDDDAPSLVLRSEACNAPTEEDAGMDDDAGGLDASSGGLDASEGGNANVDAAPRPCATDCSDSVPCTEDRCVDGECVHEPYTGARECDGIACTEGDQCEAGSCQAGTPNHAACPDDGNPCTAETCEVASGCNRDTAEGGSCNDQIPCTNMDVCRSGICRGTDICTGGAVCSAASGMCIACTGAADCDDGDPCTTDTCSSGTCMNAPNTNTCNDGKACTTNDRCNNRVCAGTSTCPADATCGGSTCRCNDSGETLCGNTCVDTSSSAQHCGRCDRACASGASCENGACKPSGASNCTAYRHAGHDYLFCPDRLSWTSARDRCRGHGFGLLIIESQTENEFVRARLNNVTRWIGANDRGNNGEDNCTLDNEEGTWYWANPTGGTDSNADNYKLFCAFTSQNANSCTAMNGGYQNWRANEPNNDFCECRFFRDCDEGEDCGVIYGDGTWNDARCGDGYAFICETP